MFCPLLEEFLASELHRESAIAKGTRKFNEERRPQAAQATHPPRAYTPLDAAASLLPPPSGKGNAKAEKAAARASQKAQ
eukprot:7788491-Pyramimonas_sp.AAC.1